MKGYQQGPANLPSMSYLSFGKIATMLDDPAKFWAKYFKGYKKEPTAAMIQGRILHEAVLMPEEFNKNAIVHTFKDFRTNAAKDWKKETLEVNPNAIICSQEEKQEILDIVDAVRSHPRAGRILQASSLERHGYAEDGEFGLLYSRPDFITSDGIKGDLKFVQSVNDHAFRYQMFDALWHMQLCFYGHVDHLITGNENEEDKCFIVVEKEFPYVTEVKTLDRSFEGMGNILWRRGAAQIRDHLARGPNGEREVWFAKHNGLSELSPTLNMLERDEEFKQFIGIGG